MLGNSRLVLAEGQADRLVAIFNSYSPYGKKTYVNEFSVGATIGEVEQSWVLLFKGVEGKTQQ